MSKKILLIGPLSPPITGNSLANDVLVRGFKNKKSLSLDIVNTQNENFNNNLGKFTLNKALFTLKTYGSLYKIFRNNLVYITPGQTFLGVLKVAPFIFLAKFLGKKVVIHIHGNYLKEQYKALTGLKKFLFKSTLKRADKGIVLSSSLIANLSPFLPSNKIRVVANFVEDSLRPEDESIRKIKLLKLFFLSNLMEEKGVMDMVHALEVLRKKEIPFQAKFAGNIEGKLQSDLAVFFKQEQYEYLGVIQGQKKKELLASSNVFILPTYYKMEGVPIAILEAMAHGNIIITTQHAGIPDILSERNALFVRSQAPQEIAEALEQIHSNPQGFETMRHSNLKESQKYTESEFLNSLLEIFLNA